MKTPMITVLKEKPNIHIRGSLLLKEDCTFHNSRSLLQSNNHYNFIRSAFLLVYLLNCENIKKIMDLHQILQLFEKKKEIEFKI